MIKTLRVFGDSYVAPEYTGNITGNSRDGVIHRLQKKLSVSTARNYAAHGSCFEFSVKNLIFRMRYQEIKPGDLIIFCVTTAGRIANKSTCDINVKEGQVFPTLAAGGSGLLHYDYTKESEHPPSISSHILDTYAHENREGLLFTILEKDYEVDRIHHFSMYCLLLSFAKAHPENKFVIINVQNGLEMNDVCIPEIPDNCIIYPLPISDADQGEIYWDPDILDFFKRKNSHTTRHSQLIKYTGQDPRINHLTIPNTEVFVNHLYEGIKNWNFDHVNEDDFYKTHWKIPKTAEEYLKQVEENILDYKPGFEMKYAK